MCTYKLLVLGLYCSLLFIWDCKPAGLYLGHMFSLLLPAFSGILCEWSCFSYSGFKPHMQQQQQHCLTLILTAGSKSDWTESQVSDLIKSLLGGKICICKKSVVVFLSCFRLFALWYSSLVGFIVLDQSVLRREVFTGPDPNWTRANDWHRFHCWSVFVVSPP